MGVDLSPHLSPQVPLEASRHYDNLNFDLFSDDEGPGNPMVSKFDEDVHFDEYDTGFNQQQNINGSDNQDYESL